VGVAPQAMDLNSRGYITGGSIAARPSLLHFSMPAETPALSPRTLLTEARCSTVL
jgi:hypothetical protein